MKGRNLNILLSSLQVLGGLITYMSLMINVGQEAKPSMILKAFVSLKMIVLIDDMFADTLPKDFKVNAKHLEKDMVIGEDHNEFRKIWYRMRFDKSEEGGISQFLQSLVINIWYFILHHIQLLWFNYFAAIYIIAI